MAYKFSEHKRNFLNGIASSFTVAVFIGVLYDTQSWLAAIFSSLIYGIIAFFGSWLFVKNR